MAARHPLKKKIDAFIGPVHGHKTPTGCPRMRNSTYVRKYNERPFIFLDKIRPSHAAYLKPGLKVCASLFTLKTLLYFDADTHRFGSTADVCELFLRLRWFFPHMPKPVVDERGGSGWLVVDTRIRYGKDKCRAACTEAEYNRTIFRRARDTSPELCLERWFQGLADGLDIEFCEVKGKVYEHNLAGGRLLSVKAGDLMKVPPSGEWLTQPSIPFEVLLKLAESNVVKTSSPSSARQRPRQRRRSTGLHRSRRRRRRLKSRSRPAVSAPES